MPSFYTTNATLAARTLTAGQVGLVGPSGLQFANAAPSVTMSGDALLSVQGLVAYYGDIVNMPAIAVTGAARIAIAASGMVIGPYQGISGSISGLLHIDNAGKIGAAAPITVTGGGLFNLVNSGSITTATSSAVVASGGPAVIVNRGDINGIDSAIAISGALRVTIQNTGTLSSFQSSVVDVATTGGAANPARVINRGDITGEARGIEVSGTGTLRLENHGTISAGREGTAGQFAVSGTAQADTVVNRGTIEGGVFLNAGNDSFDGRKGGASFVNGGDGADTLTGGVGDDTFLGGNGNDALRGGAGDDALNGGADLDVLIGGAGDDALNGADANDTLGGGAGDDFIDGGSGADLIFGGAGDDTMKGGNGSDVFVFRRGHGDDVIQDFQNNVDKLDLRFFGLTATTLKNDHAKASGTGVLIDLRALGGGTIQVDGLTYAQLDAADLTL